jgi:ABC-type nitrate/sulfonate/bicarbonate transport system substrate-binding protein
MASRHLRRCVNYGAAVILFLCHLAHGESRAAITISYPNGGSSWPLFIAKNAGYYSQNGLEVNLVFSPYPAGLAMLSSGEAQVVTYALEQVMVASMRDASFALIACPTNRGMFALLAWNDIKTLGDLKGKRIGVGEIGDASYGYSAALIQGAGLTLRDVEWIPTGPDVASRVAALSARHVDAALLTAPAYFKLIGGKIHLLTDISRRRDLFASVALLMEKTFMVAHPEVPRTILGAEAEAIQRFYADKAFAIRTYRQYNRGVDEQDAERLYDLYANAGAFERVPYVLADAIKNAIEHQPDPVIAGQMKAFDFRRVVNNNVIETLVQDGFYNRTFGPPIKPIEERAKRASFGNPVRITTGASPSTR